ncbi:MAG TPA: glycosyltransferase [Bacteroidales bacterium]|nr:glycosyltransferase [Bacteroidales bacterium]
MKITILIPAYNEQDNIAPLIQALDIAKSDMPDYQWEYLFVNDGSTDGTLSILEALHNERDDVAYVDLSRNFGKENAMLAGFDYATGDAMIIMDADLQDPPSVIKDMVLKWREGYDDVYARRKSRGRESWLRKQLSLTFYRILQGSTKIDILPNVGDFRLLDRKCIEAMRKLRESGRYTKGLFTYIGFRKTAVEFDRNDRTQGKSSFNFGKLFALAMEGITSYTTAPLRLATLVGVLVSLLAFIYMVYVFVKALLFGDPVAGYPTLMTVILFLGGVQLLTIGIIGEYLARVFNEVKQRPVYFVRDYKETKKQ